jgi:signal transduction histidine kinase
MYQACFPGMRDGLKSGNEVPENGIWRTLANGFAGWLGRRMDASIPEEFSTDPERMRRSRLVTRFGFTGAFFGAVYAAFYLLIGHVWGAAIILFCSGAFAIAPLLLRRTKSPDLAGNVLACIHTTGFSALCLIEGGMQGHAIAWLVSVPLCALLLVGRRAATGWAVVALAVVGGMIGLDIAGKTPPLAYDPRWTHVVSAAGYLGLILIMFILGLVFESSRARALARMQEALASLAATNERLVHLNNEKNEFLGIAAHDLKNPLTVIAGSAELLTRTQDGSTVGRLSGNILRAATRMRNLIMNLLDVNAIEEGKFNSRVESCDLGALLELSVEQNRPAAVRKEIEIRVGVSEGCRARGDRAAILQILDNLISNALKYSPPKTTVHVHTMPEREHVLVSIRDEGPGINEEDQKKLFQKFSRLSARPTGGESSTGLGLAIVKRLAEAMSGTVRCHSAPGSGATFTLRLPAWSGKEPEEVGPLLLSGETRMVGGLIDPKRNDPSRN